jgi:hypothetical protein
MEAAGSVEGDGAVAVQDQEDRSAESFLGRAVAVVTGIRAAGVEEQDITNRPAQPKSHAIRAETACR